MQTLYIALYFDKRFNRYLRVPDSSIYTRSDIERFRNVEPSSRNINWIAQPINVSDWSC